jgi:lysozyme family protein
MSKQVTLCEKCKRQVTGYGDGPNNRCYCHFYPICNACCIGSHLSSKSYSKDPAFCAVYPFVLQVEGKYADKPLDKGGPTMYGIAWNYNQQALKKLGLTRSTMRKLTKEQALQIYYEDYWLASGAAGMTDEGLAYMHLDTAVNCGVGAAKNMLTKLSVNPKNFNGKGDANEALFLRLCFEYMILRLDHYTNMSEEQRREFLTGWVNRMEIVGAHAHKLV